MNYQDLLNLIVAYFNDARLFVILGLVAVDVLFGIWASIKEGQFDWRKIGQFYQTMVIPYVGGYLTLYVGFNLVPALEGILGESLVTGAFGVVIANLGASVFSNFARLDLFKRRE